LISILNQSICIDNTEYFLIAGNFPFASVKAYLNAKTCKSIVQQENSKRAGVYLWHNSINTKYYVGSSNSLWDRLRKYYSDEYLNRPETRNLPIISALKKYGHDNFSLHILEYVEKDKKDFLLKREQYHLDSLLPEYNILDKAGSSLGYQHTEETKLLLSEMKTGIYDGENNPFYGKTHSDEFKLRMREFQSSREDHPFSISGENAINYGKIHSEDTKLQMSLGRLGEKNPSYGHTYATPPMKVSVFSPDGVLIGEYDSLRKAAMELKSSVQTIKKYASNQNVFNGKYRFKIGDESN
jgi:group I intron endonuclease